MHYVYKMRLIACAMCEHIACIVLRSSVNRMRALLIEPEIYPTNRGTLRMGTPAQNNMEKPVLT